MVERYCIFPKMYCCGCAWSVKSKLRMIFYIILHPAVLIYDFLIFITSSSSFHGFNTNQFNDLLWVGLLAQLSKVRILYKPEFFQAFFSQLKSCVTITTMIFFHVKIIFVAFRWSICLFVSSGRITLFS